MAGGRKAKGSTKDAKSAPEGRKEGGRVEEASQGEEADLVKMCIEAQNWHPHQKLGERAAKLESFSAEPAIKYHAQARSLLVCKYRGLPLGRSCPKNYPPIIHEFPWKT